MNDERIGQSFGLPGRRRHSITITLVATLAIVAATGNATPRLQHSGAGARAAAAPETTSVASHIPSAGAEARAPVAVIDRDDIELSGMKSVRDFLTRLDYNSFGLHRPFVLGADRVAMLVNGHRVSDSNVDFDTIPISAVERIEILSDSASALHGGHAAGGAINIVLRRDHEGAEFQIGADRPAAAGGDAEHVSALWGGAPGSGRLTIGADYFQRQEVHDANRDYSRASWSPGGPFAATSGVSSGGNTLQFGITDSDGAVTGRFSTLGECSEDVYTGPLTLPAGLGRVCGFPFADTKWLDGFGNRERGSLFVAADHPIGGKELYIDARAASGEAEFRYAPSVGTFDYTLSDELKRRLADEHGISPDNILTQAQAIHRFVGHGNREWRTDTEEYDLAAGIRGEFGNGVGHDARLRLYRYDALENGGTFVSQRLIENAVEEGRYDVENPLDPNLSEYPNHWDAVRETSVRLSQDRVIEHETARVAFDGPAFAARGGEARWTAGAELAWEDYRHVREHRDPNGNFVPTSDALGSGGTSAAGERRRWSGFAEIAVPLLDAWDLGVAGRRDDHDDVGATFSWQLANRFRASDALALRASWSEGGSAPSLHALHERDVVDRPHVTDRRNQACNPCQRRFITAGNPNLKPDETKTFNAGAVADMGPLSLSLDWFRIKISDSAGTLSPQSILDLEAQGRPLPPGTSVVRDPGGNIEHIRTSRLNVVDRDVVGLDVRAGADWNAGGTDIGLDVRWVRVTRNETRVHGRLEPLDFPRHRLHASLGASRGDVTALWSIHALSGYRNESRNGRYDGWAGHDIVLRWRNAFGREGLHVTAGVINAGDRAPPVDSASPNERDLRLDSVLGRTLFLTAKVSFDP